MRVFVIHDSEIENDNVIGFLLYYEKSDEYIVELREELDEWNCPLLFSGLIKKGIYTIPKDIARLWVEERVIPSDRQNIGIILRNAKLTNYNEINLLAISQGKSSQDNCFVEEIDKGDLPVWVTDRQVNNILESFPIVDNRVICLLGDDTAIEVDLEKCSPEVSKLNSILSNQEILSTLKVDAGGYGITFNDSISIDKRILIEHGVVLPIYAHVFKDFADHCCVNTTEACSILNCSRQNLGYLIKNDALHPIKDKWRENVFFRGEITRMD